MLILPRLFYALIFFLIISCSKSGSGSLDDSNNGNDPHIFNSQDLIAPVLAINTPVANQVFSSGNSIQVTGRVTDDYGLYRGTIRIINDATGFDIKQQAFEIHGLKTYDFNLSTVVSVSVPTDLTVVVFFEDHGYNGNTKNVKVRIEP